MCECVDVCLCVLFGVLLFVCIEVMCFGVCVMLCCVGCDGVCLWVGE